MRPWDGGSSVGRHLPTLEVTATFRVDLASPRRARQLMSAALDDAVTGDVLDVAILLMSEVVTNAARHGGGATQVSISQLAEVVRVEVSDHSAQVPVRLPADPAQDESGRGLLLLEELAAHWGTHLSSSGKTVWYEVALN